MTQMDDESNPQKNDDDDDDTIKPSRSRTACE
jgi:hypothetical protein